MPKTDAEKKEYKRLWYLKNKDKYKCEHSRQKNTCIECGGSGICEHSRQKSTCIECGGSGVCEHNKSKYIWTITKIRNKGFNVIMEIDMVIRNNFRVFKIKI